MVNLLVLPGAWASLSATFTSQFALFWNVTLLSVILLPFNVNAPDGPSLMLV